MRFVFCFVAVAAMSAPAMSQDRNDRTGEAVAIGILEALMKGLSGGDRTSGKPGESGSFSNGRSGSSSPEVLWYVKFSPQGRGEGLFYRNIGPLVSKEGYGYFTHSNAQYNRVYAVNGKEYSRILSRINSNPYWSRSMFGNGFGAPSGTSRNNPLVIMVRQEDIRAKNPDGRSPHNPLGKGGGSASRFKRDTENSARDAGKQIQRFFRSPFGN